MPEDAELRGTVGVMREAFALLVARVDALIIREAEASDAQRRTTLTITVAAVGLVLSALVVIVRLLLA